MFALFFQESKRTEIGNAVQQESIDVLTEEMRVLREEVRTINIGVFINKTVKSENIFQIDQVVDEEPKKDQ